MVNWKSQNKNCKAKHVLAFCIFVLIVITGSSHANIQKPNVIKDLHYGEVLFHFYQEDYFTSIVHLLAARQLNRTTNHAPDDEILLGGIDLSYGLHKESARIFNELLESNARDTVKNRAYYYLAKIYYQRGYIEEASHFLSKIHGPVQENIFGELKLLIGQVHLAQGEFDSAINALYKWNGPKEFKHYANYNLGVAYTKKGDIDTGIEHLKKVGKLKAKTESMRTLRDKSNLASGLTLIQNERPAEAIDYLEKVRVQGLYSNMALLGIGWANTEAEKPESALVPLMELRNRSAYHSEVQEGILALAFAYSEMGLKGRAVQAYEKAANIYLDESKELAKSADEIKNGALVNALLERTKGGPQMGWFWTLHDIPDLPEVKYFTELLAEHEFHEALKNFRDLLYLKQNLEYWDENIDIYMTMLDTRKTRYHKYLPLVVERINNLDLNALNNQKSSLANELDLIEKEDGFMQLATSEEKKKLFKIKELEKRIEILKKANVEPEKITEMEEKLFLMNGVLEWQIHKDYMARKWEHKKEINELSKHLRVTPDKRLSIKEAIGDTVNDFDEFEARIIALQKEIKRLIPIADSVFIKQSKYLENVAITELKKRENILLGYERHARTALAAAYDQAASQPKIKEEGTE